MLLGVELHCYDSHGVRFEVGPDSIAHTTSLQQCPTTHNIHGNEQEQTIVMNV